MPRMIDLVRVSALPSNLMHSASKGSLAVPAEEMVEILVYLATKNQIFGQQARFTLASWDEAASKVVAANPKTSKEVLAYLISPQNLRPALLPALLENPSVGQGALEELASTSTSRDVLEAMLKSPRINKSHRLLEVLNKNPNLPAHKAEQITEKVQAAAPAASVAANENEEIENEEVEEKAVPASSAAVPEAAEGAEEITTEITDEDVKAYLAEHAAEIAAEGDKPFQAIGGIYDEIEPESPAAESKPAPAPAPEVKAEPEVKKPDAKKPEPKIEERRGSVLQKIAKLDIRGRIQLAMKGNKEERSLLIRDGTKIVALAVLDSPKVTDGEVEKFASQKNVLEAVLRGIPLKRKYAKHYPVIRNLVFNPRTPLDLSLGLMKHLLVQDLRNLAGNKEVSDTVRKLGIKLFKQKTDTTKKNV